ncbi:tight adherence protein B [Arthrobacter pigmenti]|uniref:Tight adherence protein B n=1 Tax=Arthrobacter pigmenti TaxID=271432 RepID=A0A846RIU2_9MICC|nr:type II secretion system F family protein [Arthrobacter pigmenti]NJC23133.1 tight adherence protein B [Arthrobacter pigmenti]
MTILFVGGTLFCVAAVVLVVIALRPRQSAVPLDRRRPPEEESTSQLTRFAGSAVRAMERYLRRHPKRLYRQEILDTAGVRLSQADVFLLVISGGFAGLLLGWAIAGPFLGILLLVLSPFAAQLVLVMRTGRRRAKFDSQLGDTLQLLTGGLRAGHSILRAIDAAATEADAPTSDEMRRVVTETSLGKDLLVSLLDASRRMESDDFAWIAQAIQINREVGGDLAEVLDHVAETIRERSEIKGQIRALSAEGKFSAYILVALPFGIGAMLMLVSPGYVTPLFTEPLGWIMIGASAIMMSIGGLWLRKIIDLKF